MMTYSVNLVLLFVSSKENFIYHLHSYFPTHFLWHTDFFNYSYLFSSFLVSSWFESITLSYFITYFWYFIEIKTFSLFSFYIPQYIFLKNMFFSCICSTVFRSHYTFFFFFLTVRQRWLYSGCTSSPWFSFLFVRLLFEPLLWP